jgi:hypothetical protein
MRGYLVEGVRLIFIALLATGGFLLGGTVAAESTGRALGFIFLGAAVGFVIGGVAGRLTLRAVSGMERELHRRPARNWPAVAGLITGSSSPDCWMIPRSRAERAPAISSCTSYAARSGSAWVRRSTRTSSGWLA